MQLSELLASMPRLEELNDETRQYCTEQSGETLSPEFFCGQVLAMRQSLSHELGKHGVENETLTELRAMSKNSLLRLGEIGFQLCQLQQLDGEIRLQAMGELFSLHQE